MVHVHIKSSHPNFEVIVNVNRLYNHQHTCTCTCTLYVTQFGKTTLVVYNNFEQILKHSVFDLFIQEAN